MTQVSRAALAVALALALAPPALAEDARSLGTVAPPSAASSPRPPPVHLRLDRCVGSAALGVRRIVTLELDAQLVGDAPLDRGGASERPDEATRVVARCTSGGSVQVEVHDPVTSTCLTRRVDLEQVAELARARTLAMVIVEAVAASWVEPGAGNGSCSAGARPSPEADRRAAARYDGMSRSAWVAALGFSRPGPMSSSRCVPLSLRQRLITCPIDSPPPAHGDRGGPPPRDEETPPPPAEPTAAVDLTAPPPSSRARRGSHQQELILRRQIALTRALNHRTQEDHPDRPAVLLRLAGHLVELAQLERPASGALGPATAPLTEACQHLRALIDTAPHHPERPRSLLWLARLSEQLAAADDDDHHHRAAALQAHRELARDHPGSPQASWSRVALAEHALDQGRADDARRLLDLAAADGSPARLVALYRRAWCQVAQGRDREAVSDFVELLQATRAAPDAPLASELARAARRELILPFSRGFDPARAWPLFRRVGGGQAAAMLEALGERLAEQGRWAAAAATYRRLLSRGQPQQRCHAQARLAEAVGHHRPPAELLIELRRAADLVTDERSCRRLVARQLVDAATRWHLEAVDAEASPGRSDAAPAGRADQLYQLALETFDDLDELELDGWPRDQRPTRYRLRYWHAELLLAAGRWERCGRQFDRVANRGPEGERFLSALEGAAHCWDRILGPATTTPTPLAIDAGDEALRPLELTQEQRSASRAFARLGCVEPEPDQVAALFFRRAQLRYQARQFEEAAALLGEVVALAPDAELAALATRLQISALDAIGRTNPERVEGCAEEIDAVALRAIDDRRLTPTDADRAHLQGLRCALRWARAERYRHAGQFDRCSSSYLELYREYADQCRQLEGHGLDELLYNAAICLESDYRIGPAIQVRRRLLEEHGAEANEGRASPWARRALYQIAGNYHSIAAYGRAAEHYERFARRFPDEPEAARALRDATAIRLSLGQHDAALADSRLFERHFGRRRATDAARVINAVGTIFLHQERWAEAERHYRAFLRRYGGRAALDDLLIARVHLGTALWHLRDQHPGAAEAAGLELRAALALSQRGQEGQETAVERLERSRQLLNAGHRADDAEVTRRISRMLDAVAEARFLLAEAARARFTAIALPPFRPSDRMTPSVRAFWARRLGAAEARRWEQALRLLPLGERRRQLAQAQFEHWGASALVHWARQREAARERAEQAYLAVMAEGVPRWEIAAAARVGEMDLEMMRALQQAPLPPLVRDDAELRALYEAGLDQAAAPYRHAALDAFERCLSEATGNRWFDSWSRRCERQLHRLSPQDYPLADEFRASPTHTRPALALPSFVNRITAPPAAERDRSRR